MKRPIPAANDGPNEGIIPIPELPIPVSSLSRVPYLSGRFIFDFVNAFDSETAEKLLKNRIRSNGD